jgi:hypothetical protein
VLDDICQQKKYRVSSFWCWNPVQLSSWPFPLSTFEGESRLMVGLFRFESVAGLGRACIWIWAEESSLDGLSYARTGFWQRFNRLSLPHSPINFTELHQMYDSSRLLRNQSVNTKQFASGRARGHLGSSWWSKVDVAWGLFDRLVVAHVSSDSTRCLCGVRP